MTSNKTGIIALGFAALATMGHAIDIKGTAPVLTIKA